MPKKATDPFAQFGRKPTRRKRKNRRTRENGIQSSPGEWFSESSDSDADTSRTMVRKRNKTSPKSGKLEVPQKPEEDGQYDTATSMMDGEETGEEGPTKDYGKKKGKSLLSSVSNLLSFSIFSNPSIVITPGTPPEEKKGNDHQQEATGKETSESEMETSMPETQKEEELENGEIGNANEPPRGPLDLSSDKIRDNEVAHTEEVDYMEYMEEAQKENANDSEAPLNDEAAQLEANILVLGGSNARDTENFIVEPENMKIQATYLCEGGQKMGTMTCKLNDIDDDAKERISVVIAHVGSVDFPCAESEANHNFDKYKEEIACVHENVPNADIIMSGVPPRLGESEHSRKTNVQIKAFNKRLDGHKETNSYLYFIDCWKFLTDDNEIVKRDLYKLNDPDGIHLNDAGREALANAWLSEVERLSHMHYERKMNDFEGAEALTPTN